MKLNLKKLVLPGVFSLITSSLWAAEAVDPNLVVKAQLDNLALIAITLGITAMILLMVLIMFFAVNSKMIAKYNKKSTVVKAASVTAVFFLMALPVFAQTAPQAVEAVQPGPNPLESAISLISWIIIGLGALNVGLVVGVLYGFDYYLRVVHQSSLGNILPDFGLSALFSWDKLAGLKAAKKGSHMDTALDHRYDGIVELDNPAPPLFNYILYGTIIFAVVYWTAYHVVDSAPLQIEEYQIAMAEANAQKAEMMKLAANQVDENNVKPVTDPAMLAEGKDVFKANCAACHGDNGEGKVGPNFTDEYWLHGGGVQNIFKTIKYGVPAKGMIAWEKQLAPGQIANVTSYILSLKGTNPPNGKQPEGEKWVEGNDSSATAADSSAKKEISVKE